MKRINCFIVAVAAATLVLAVVHSTASTSSPVKNEDLKMNQTQNVVQAINEANSANQQDSFSIAHKEQPTTSGRSMEGGEKKTSRGGRMLDLDHLAGDIGKDEKMAKERSLSGQRQSRILSEDIAVGDKKTAEGRSKKSKGKKMAISGFIPIVSLEQAKEGKHFASQLSGEDENEDENNDEQESVAQPQQPYNTKEQLLSNYGGQTSIGHASFGPQPAASNEQQSQANQWQQLAPQYQEAGRARKLLGSSGILNSLTGPKRTPLISTLVPPVQSHLQQQHHQLQAPMNVPPVFQQGELGDCICVPFFQCKNGYLLESQLSKSQQQQIIGFQSQPAMNLGHQHQVPRALTYAGSAQQPSISSIMSQLEPQQQVGSQVMIGKPQLQPNEQQMIVNDIYEQLRKNIENENLEQQLQQQQQYQQDQLAYQPLDERSKFGVLQADNASVSVDLQERSLLSSLGRRSSGGQLKQRCGIMRICCKVPPTLVQQANHQFGAPHRGQRLNMANQQPGYPMLRPQQQPPFQQQPAQAAHHLINGQQQQLAGDYQQDYQPATSSMLPSLSQQQYHQLTGPPPMSLQPSMIAEQHLQRPIGSFMAGRCGIRQALGISGRVQNTQLAPGSESSAEFGEFPAHAAILKRLSPGDSLFVCSAVLVSNQWLATAAHCVRKSRPEELKVRLGEWDVNRDDEFYPFVESNVREIVIHPEFQSTSLSNDIALLRIETVLDPQQMPHITPACLATPEEQFVHQRCWLAGWGKDAFGQTGTFQSVLKKVDLPVVGRQECESALRYQTKLGKFFRLHQSAMCAGGERGKDACEGDGGSGLYCQDPESGLTKVVGVVSWGIGCGQKGVPGVYTNLAVFYQWIESVVATSGEESVYLDRANNGISEQAFKNLISERSNLAATNGTQSAGQTTTLATNSNSTTTVTYGIEEERSKH